MYLPECTFLGPSRKRGPPKGYIDAIEARLHQTEALIGILLSSKDSRAKSVLDDLAEVSEPSFHFRRFPDFSYAPRARLDRSIHTYCVRYPLLSTRSLRMYGKFPAPSRSLASSCFEFGNSSRGIFRIR